MCGWRMCLSSVQHRCSAICSLSATERGGAEQYLSDALSGVLFLCFTHPSALRTDLCPDDLLTSRPLTRSWGSSAPEADRHQRAVCQRRPGPIFTGSRATHTQDFSLARYPSRRAHRILERVRPLLAPRSTEDSRHPRNAFPQNQRR